MSVLRPMLGVNVAPAVVMVTPFGTVMSHPLRETVPGDSKPVTVMFPLVVTFLSAEAVTSPPKKPPCARISAVVMFRDAM